MKKMIFMLLLLGVCFGLQDRGHAEKLEYPNAAILVTPDSLERNLNDENFYIIDVRKEGYTAGHIPGAVHFNMNLLIDKDHPIKGHLVKKEKFEKDMKQHGINNNYTIVIYDEGGETAATRLFYALEYFGQTDVKVLNGGFAAWEAANKDRSTTEPVMNLGDFKATEKQNLMVMKEEVKAVIGKCGVVLLDVRSPEEYKGEDVRADRGGHIPSAVNVEWKSVLKEGEVPVFKSASDLLALLKGVGVTKDKKIVIYCHTAKRASHMYFTLRLLGYKNLTVYEGSWEEWGNETDTPIVDLSKIERDLSSL